MRIDVVAPTTAWFSPDRLAMGLGGNEATLLLWTEGLRDRGHAINVHMSGTPSEAESAFWCPERSRKTDLLVSWRSVEPLHRTEFDNARRVLFIGDRRTHSAELGLARRADLVLAGSYAAISMHEGLLKGTPTVVLPLGHAAPDLDVDRVPFSVVHTAAPYRGLANILEIWPHLHALLPQAVLTVLGGYQLWDYGARESRQLLETDLRGNRLDQPGVEYLGAVPRDRYWLELARSEVYAYPTQYEETCCIGAIEAAAVGTVPWISAVAALSERVTHNQTGVLMEPYEGPSLAPAFASDLYKLLMDRERLRTLSIAARKDVQLLTIRKVVERLEHAFAKLL